MKNINRIGRGMLVLCLLSLPLTATDAEQLAGWIENVRLYPGDIEIKAKLDTGAKFSSLGCDCTTTFMRDGKEWVRFTVTGENGHAIVLERKIMRWVKIKRHFGELQRRMVVKMGICLGKTYKEVEVTLIDRTGFLYAMLLGRDYMAGKVFVDPGKTFRTRPRCGSRPLVQG